MLEDIPEDAELIQRVIRKEGIDFIPERVDTKQEFIDALKSFNPDVILSDHSLPQFNSMEAFEAFKQSGLDVPFILVTGAVSEEFAVSCIKLGIDDYILKSNLTRLPVAIINAIHQRKLEQVKRKSEKALKSQNKTLIKINRELDNFAYNVSHNLRAPLASVLGLINIIKIESVYNDPKFTELISMMEYSIKKLDLTLMHILNYSRNTRIDSKIEPVDLASVIDECFREVQYLDGSNYLRKKINIVNNATFYSDKYRVMVILNNLISNAIKYLDPGKKQSILNIDVIINPDRLELYFEDNGIGIAKDQLPNIYNMFYRGTEKSDGSGLGLYIVKEMIDRLNGHINISSIPGKSTKIEISVPNHKP